jgi:hypothetical protein
MTFFRSCFSFVFDFVFACFCLCLLQAESRASGMSHQRVLLRREARIWVCIYAMIAKTVVCNVKKQTKGAGLFSLNNGPYSMGYPCAAIPNVLGIYQR